MRRSGRVQRPDGDAERDREESPGHGNVHPGDHADAVSAVPELPVGQAVLERGRRDHPGVLRLVLDPVRRPHSLVPPCRLGQPGQCQHQQHRHQDSEHDLAGRITGDVMPAERCEPPLMRGEPGPRRLISNDVRADHHRDQGRVHRQRQRAEPGRQTMQPEPPGRLTGPSRAHPAGQVPEQERQQRQPQHPDLAPRGQSAPRVDLHVPVYVRARGPVLLASPVVRGSVETRDRIAADLLGSHVAESRVRRRPAHTVHAQLGDAAASGRRRKLHARHRHGVSGNWHIGPPPPRAAATTQ